MRLKCLGLETIIEVVTVYNELACTKVLFCLLFFPLTRNVVPSRVRQLQYQLCISEFHGDPILPILTGLLNLWIKAVL